MVGIYCQGAYTPPAGKLNKNEENIVPPLPVVSIVGRPNVGKSSLFNRILKEKVAVVDDAPGVTRDRNYKDTSWSGCNFTVVDTGGLIPTSKDSIPSEIHKQVDIAIKESSAIIFLVEAQTGPTDLDLLIARQLMKECPEKVILAANKAESEEAGIEASRHCALGCGDPFPISALHGKGIGDLLDKVCLLLTQNIPGAGSLQKDTSLAIAIVGRPNSGKSSFVNKLLNNDRMIVDDVPGTTRDAIDSVLTYNNMQIRLIDTAGLRKKAQVHDNIEYYCNMRAIDSIRKCDICVLLIDTTLKLGEQDLKILKHTIKNRKGMVICWNKWDLVDKDSKTFDALVAEAKKTYKEIKYVPMVSVSALTGQRVAHVIDMALEIKRHMVRRIKPSQLRDNFFDWVKTHPHPYVAPRDVRFLGIKQIYAEHPHFNIFCTNPKSVAPSYRRFLINKLQDTYGYSGCPIALTFKTAGLKKRGKENTGSDSSERE